jgi:Carboxypeptidase regulatory-like domain
MKAVCLAHLLVGLLLAAAAQAAGNSIAGVVQNAATGEPVAGAQVTIVPLEHSDQRANIVTDSDGRFSLGGIPAGRYELSAKRRGFLAQRYEERAGLSPAIVTGPGLDTEHIVFRLSPPAVVAGKVVDEAGEPVAQATVELLSSAVIAGRRRVTPFSVKTTDDLGQYRFAPLPPGAYYLVVSGYPWYTRFAGALPDTTPSSPTRIGYGVKYYPDSSDPSAAELLTLRPAQEATANFTLLPVPAVSLNIGIENGDNAVKQLTLSAAGVHGNRVYVRQWSEPGDNYSFEAVPPGHYVLTAQVTDTQPALYARREIELGATDTDVMLTLQDAPALAGTVAFEGNAKPANVAVVLTGQDTGRVHTIPVGEDGKFSLPELPPQRYSVSLAAGDAYLKSWTVEGGHSRDSQTLEVPEGVRAVRLRMVLARGAGRIDGSVMRDDHPVPAALVVLAPAGGSDRPEDYRACRAAADGSYSFQGMPPGDFALFAVEDAAEFEYADPAVIRPYLAAAHKLHVIPGGSYTERLEPRPAAR